MELLKDLAYFIGGVVACLILSIFPAIGISNAFDISFMKAFWSIFSFLTTMLAAISVYVATMKGR